MRFTGSHRNCCLSRLWLGQKELVYPQKWSCLKGKIVINHSILKVPHFWTNHCSSIRSMVMWHFSLSTQCPSHVEWEPTKSSNYVAERWGRPKWIPDTFGFRDDVDVGYVGKIFSCKKGSCCAWQCIPSWVVQTGKKNWCKLIKAIKIR